MNNNSSNASDTTLGCKTIAQRADEYATQQVGGRYTKGELGDLWQYLRHRYIEIATAQQELDIEKAKDFANKWLDEIIELWLPDLKKEPYRSQAHDNIIAKLTKAMKGE